MPIPVPLPFFSFTGWRGSLHGDLHAYGKRAVFYTETKTVTKRWFIEHSQRPQYDHSAALTVTLQGLPTLDSNGSTEQIQEANKMDFNSLTGIPAGLCRVVAFADLALKPIPRKLGQGQFPSPPSSRRRRVGSVRPIPGAVPGGLGLSRLPVASSSSASPWAAPHYRLSHHPQHGELDAGQLAATEVAEVVPRLASGRLLGSCLLRGGLPAPTRPQDPRRARHGEITSSTAAGCSSRAPTSD